MTALLQAIASAKPREKAGAHTMARYGFQVHASILKMLDLHRNGADYRAAFDHFDDLMVFDRADQPEKVDFFQIKSQGMGEWTLRGHLPICLKLHASQNLNEIKGVHKPSFGHSIARRRFLRTFPCKTVFQNRPQRQSGFEEDGVPAMLFLPCDFEQIGK